MSDIPQAKQLRREIGVVGGAVAYEVTTSIVDKGDLPFAELFVVTIVDPLDPKADLYARLATPLEFRREAGVAYVKCDATDALTVDGDLFARVASPDELTTLPHDRAVAVARGRTAYLTSAITLVYEDLTTARAAYRQLVSRLSALVVEWRAADTDFATHPSVTYDLPATDDAEVVTRTATWRAARDARVAAEVTRDAATATRVACEAQGAQDRALFDLLTADVAFLQLARTTVYATATSAARTFALDGSDTTSYESLLVAKRAALATARTAVATRAATCAANRRAELAAAAGVEAARTAEVAAEAAVLVVCADFDPATA